MKIRKLLTLVIIAATLGLFIWYFINNINDFRALLMIPWWSAVVVVMAIVVSIIANGYFIKLIMHASHLEISQVNATKASIISAVGNFFFPTGVGSIAQARYLKSSHHFSYTKYITSLSGNYILIFLVNGLLGLLALLFIPHNSTDPSYWTMLVIFSVMAGVNLCFAIFGVPTLSAKGQTRYAYVRRLKDVINRVAQGWNDLIKNKKLIILLTILILVNFIVSMIVGYFSMLAINVHVGFWPLVLYGTLGAITLVLNVTPGSVGVREGVILFTMGLVGLTVPQVLMVSIIERVARFLVLAAGLLLFMDVFRSALHKHRNKEENSR